MNDSQDKNTREPRTWSPTIPKGKFHYPSTLTEIALDWQHFEPRAQGPEGEDRIKALIEEAYHAGLATEEGRSLSFRIFHGSIDVEYTKLVSFEELLPYQVDNIIKLAPAISIDNDTAIYVQDVEYSHDFPNGLQITGIAHLMSGSYEPPGQFRFLGSFPASWCITCLSPGHLRLHFNGSVLELVYGKIKYLPPMRLIRAYLDWESEVVCNILSQIEQSQVANFILEHQQWSEWEIKNAFGYIWADIIRRVREARHGGCFLIVPSEQWVSGKQHLKLKYQHNKGDKTNILHKIASYIECFAKYSMKTKKERDRELFGIIRGYEDCERSLSCLSQLSQVDGAVVFLRNLELKGFGVEIVLSDELDNQQEEMIFDCKGFEHEPAVAKPLKEYGTRHRTAFRFCKSVPGALAFVISQDGDLRIMHSFQNKVYLWDGFTEFGYY